MNLYLQIENDLKRTAYFVEKTMEAIILLQEQRKLQETKLYWLKIRMKNNSAVFSSLNRESIRELCQALDSMSYLQDEMLKMTEEIQYDVNNITDELKEVKERGSERQVEEIKGKIQTLNTRIDILKETCEFCTTTNIAFLENMVIVGEKLKAQTPKKTWGERVIARIRKGENDE